MTKIGSNTFVPQPPGTHSHEATEPSIIVFKSEDIENPATWSTVSQRIPSLPFLMLVKARAEIFMSGKKGSHSSCRTLLYLQQCLRNLFPLW